MGGGGREERRRRREKRRLESLPVEGKKFVENKCILTKSSSFLRPSPAIAAAAIASPFLCLSDRFRRRLQADDPLLLLLSL
jgi:hypothetical protein